MPDDTVAASGAQFARDLRRIRVEKDLTIQDIHDETRISVDLIESFEKHGLFEHPSFNQVYLRSFVRSYASSIGIDADLALEGLKAALEGKYGNQLAVKYLDVTPETPPVEPSEEEDGASAESSSPDEEEPSEPTPTAEKAPEPGEPITSSDASSSPPSFLPEGSQRGVLITLGIVGILVIIWGVFSLTDTSLTSDSTPETATSPASDTAAEPATTAPDTAAQPVTPPADTQGVPAAAPIALGDTMYFTLVAQESPIEGIRIRRDDDLRRPYWVEQGQAAVFPTQQEIVIAPMSDDYQLLLNGYRWPRGAQGELTITRADARSFLDSAAATPVELTVPVDTNFIPGTQVSSPSESQ